MKIAFDIDSTLNKAHYFDIINGRSICEEYGFTPLKFDPTKINIRDIFQGMPDELYQEYMKRYFPWNVNNSYPETGYQYVMSLKRNHELGIITARDDTYDKPDQPYKGWMMVRDTKEWLKRYGLSFDQIHFNAKNKYEVCVDNGYDLIIDDDPKHILECADGGIRTIIKGQSYNEYLIGHKNTSYGYNLIEVVHIINNTC